MSTEVAAPNWLIKSTNLGFYYVGASKGYPLWSPSQSGARRAILRDGMVEAFCSREAALEALKRIRKLSTFEGTGLKLVHVIRGHRHGHIYYVPSNPKHIYHGRRVCSYCDRPA